MNTDMVATATALTKVWAVCVTFDPEISIFAELVAATRPQVEGLIVVDNGSKKENREKILDLCRRAGAKIVSLPSNQGLASALNVGISQALSESATDVLLLDHDSVPDPGMVAAMLATKLMLAAKGEAVGALGAKAIDARTGRAAPFVRFGVMGIKRKHCGDSEDPVMPTDVLMTSGCLMPAGVLRAVGLMDAALFIDQVDVDWCLRAGAAGFRLYGVCGAALSHRMGDGVVQITFPVRKDVPVHSPSRLYFVVRNRLHLYSRPYAPWRWIASDAVRLLRLVTFYCVFFRKRRDYLDAAWRGVRDGCRGLRARP
jgi:rhamnosyltransferase